ncbi:MAG: protein kinase domain-containing protein, partial [Planctomycetota bacterium]
MVRQRTIEPGTLFGHLRIERELGSGAFATVYLARDTLLDRRVALKVIPVAGIDENTAERERILAEARHVAQLNSPNIVALFGVRIFPQLDAWVFELEYVDGGTLGALLSDAAPLEPRRVFAVFRGIVEALRVAHE